MRCCSPRSVRRRLFILFLAVWIVFYVGLELYSTSSPQHPTVISSPSSLSTVPPRTLSTSPEPTQDPVEAYVDRYAICDRMSRGQIRAEELNASVVYACERWTSAQNYYFRFRERQVNWFDAGRLRISGAEICSNNTYLMILVHSLHKYKDRRDAIRQTWGGASVKGNWPLTIAADHRLNSTRVRLAFIFGHLVHEKPAENRLHEESKLHGDIIQGEFGESYRNMTLKSLTGLHWVTKFCPSARYLFKCDDDMFVNVPAILDAIHSENMTGAIMGPYNTGSRVYRKGKWAMSAAEYPFYHYPPYESGSGYVINSDLWRPLLNASNYVPYIFIDDVYITGILGRIVGARHVIRSGFAYWTSKAPVVCAIVNGTVLTGTRVDPKRQLSLWTELVNGATNC